MLRCGAGVGGSVHFELVLVIEASRVARVPHDERVTVEVHSSLTPPVQKHVDQTTWRQESQARIGVKITLPYKKMLSLAKRRSAVQERTGD